MYIDVVEFRNRHFLAVFQDVPEQFRRLLGASADRVARGRGWCGRDPALVMAMIYFYFPTYFVIERLVHGNHHLGVDDHEVIERFADICRTGCGRRRAGVRRCSDHRKIPRHSKQTGVSRETHSRPSIPGAKTIDRSQD